MKFSYTKIPTKDPTRKWISRPMLTVRLFGPKGSVIVDALIDSGADKSLFHIALAEEIGLSLQHGKQEFFSGIEGGRIASFLRKIELQIVGIDKRIEIPAGFTNTPGVAAILGQEGFFDSFKIRFEKNHNTIEIKPAKNK